VRTTAHFLHGRLVFQRLCRRQLGLSRTAIGCGWFNDTTRRVTGSEGALLQTGIGGLQTGLGIHSMIAFDRWQVGLEKTPIRCSAKLPTNCLALYARPDGVALTLESLTPSPERDLCLTLVTFVQASLHSTQYTVHSTYLGK